MFRSRTDIFVSHHDSRRGEERAVRLPSRKFQKMMALIDDCVPGRLSVYMMRMASRTQRGLESKELQMVVHVVRFAHRRSRGTVVKISSQATLQSMKLGDKLWVERESTYQMTRV